MPADLNDAGLPGECPMGGEHEYMTDEDRRGRTISGCTKCGHVFNDEDRVRVMAVVA